MTSSHPCFPVAWESFPSCQGCTCSECSVLWGLPTAVLSEASCILWNFFGMQTRLCGFCANIKCKLSKEPCIDYFWLVFHSQAILHFWLLLFYFLHSSSCRLRHCFQEGLELGMNMLKNTVMLVSGIAALAYLHSYLHLHEHLWFFLSCQVRESVGGTSAAPSHHPALKPRGSNHLLHQRALGKGWHWLN